MKKYEIMEMKRIKSKEKGKEFKKGIRRVVMVRKNEKRKFEYGKDGEEKKFENVKREKVEK